MLSILITKLRTFALKLESKVVHVEEFNEQATQVDFGDFGGQKQKLIFLHFPMSLPYQKYLKLSVAHVKENIRSGERTELPLEIQSCRQMTFKQEEIKFAQDCVEIEKGTLLGRDNHTGEL